MRAAANAAMVWFVLKLEDFGLALVRIAGTHRGRRWHITLTPPEHGHEAEPMRSVDRPEPSAIEPLAAPPGVTSSGPVAPTAPHAEPPDQTRSAIR